MRICEAKFGSLYRFDGENFHFAAEVGTPLVIRYFFNRSRSFRPRSGTQLDRVLRTRQVCHSDDYAAEVVPGYAATLGGARSIVYVPMLKDDVLIGVINIYRQEARPFTDKQIELCRTSLPRPSSPSRTRGCSMNCAIVGAADGDIRSAEVISSSHRASWSLCSGPCLRMRCVSATPNSASYTSLKEQRISFRAVQVFHRLCRVLAHAFLQPIPGGPLDRVDENKAMIHSRRRCRELLLEAPASLVVRDPSHVPMLKDNVLIGAIVIYRQEVQPFTDKQIALYRTSPPRPSSPSRTRGCSTNCGNRWSNKLRRRRY